VRAGEGVVGGLVGQLGLGVAALDGDVGQVGGQRQQALLGRAGPAGLVEVDGEHAQHRVAVGGDDRGRPGGPDAPGQRDLA
jgi:hypothetical protein